MIPKLYEGTETAFTSNGLGSLADAISCVVTEERNGVYELEMEYPVGGLHYDLLQNGRIIYAKPNETSNPQPFDIKEITPSMDNMTATIYAQHIRYRLNGIPVGSFSTTGIADALSGLVTNSLEKHSFTTWTDIENTTTKFEVTTPKTFGSLLGGSDGSILDTFSGSGSYSYEFDRFKIKLWHSRGADNGVSIRYAKNLTGCKMESSVEGVYTGVLAYYEAEDTIIKSAIQYVDNHSSYPHESIYLYDCTDEYDDETPTVAQLNEKAKSYLKTNKLGEPSVSIEVNFIPLWQTEEYKNVAPLERVSLCDTVKVVFNKLGVNASAMVNKTEYDVLAERYDKITLGSVKSNMASTVKQMVNDATSGVEEATMSKAQSAINSAVEKIRGGTNGHVVLRTNANGETNELYAYDGDTLESASKVLRLNYEGIAGTNNGLNGKYNLAITTDGQVNANQITVGELDGSIIKANSITTDKLTLEFGTTTKMTMQANSTGVEFVGTGTFTNKSVGNFGLYNYANENYSVLKNSISTNTYKSGDYYRQGMWLYNYQYDSSNPANYIFMIGQQNYTWSGIQNNNLGSTAKSNVLNLYDSDESNYIDLSNYDTSSGNKANYIILKRDDENNINYIDFVNFKSGSTNKANRIYASSQLNTNLNYIYFANYESESTNTANRIYASSQLNTRNYLTLKNWYSGVNANEVLFDTTSSLNELKLSNYTNASNTVANCIDMTFNKSTSATEATITNNYSSVIANKITMTGSSTKKLEVENYKYNSSDLMNRMTLSSSSSESSWGFSNWKYDNTSKIANSLKGYSNSAFNYLDLYNYRTDGEVANHIQMCRSSGDYGYIGIFNKAYNDSSKDANYIKLATNSSGNYLKIYSTWCYLEFDVNGNMKLYTPNSFNLTTRGTTKSCYWDDNGYLRGE